MLSDLIEWNQVSDGDNELIWAFAPIHMNHSQGEWRGGGLTPL